MRTQDMIDLDEAGFKIECTNPKFGKTVTWSRCYLEGEYNREKKVNCMMAISADRNYDMEWHDIWPQEEGGTDLNRVIVFIQREKPNGTAQDSPCLAPSPPSKPRDYPSLA